MAILITKEGTQDYVFTSQVYHWTTNMLYHITHICPKNIMHTSMLRSAVVFSHANISTNMYIRALTWPLWP